MKESTPWRGAREKDPLLIQMLIESTTALGDLVMDCTASTGKSVKSWSDFNFNDLSIPIIQFLTMCLLVFLF